MTPPPNKPHAVCECGHAAAVHSNGDGWYTGACGMRVLAKTGDQMVLCPCSEFKEVK